MSLFRLHCGRNIPASTQTVSDRQIFDFVRNQPFFEGLTYFNAFGMWKTDLEKTLIIEVITDDFNKVVKLATMYKEMFLQESVLITQSQDKVNFI